jgi:hypothetical protein
MVRAPTRNRQRVNDPFGLPISRKKCPGELVPSCPVQSTHGAAFRAENYTRVAAESVVNKSGVSRNRVQGHCPWLVGGYRWFGFDVVPFHRAVHRLDAQHDMTVLKDSHRPGRFRDGDRDAMSGLGDGSRGPVPRA